MKRGQLVNHLQPKFGSIPLDEITQVMYEDWRLTLPLANSTKNDITVAINQIMKEAVRDEKIKVNPIQNVESLSKTPEKPRDATNPLTRSTIRKIFKMGLVEAKIKNGKNLVAHSLQHTFNTFMLGSIPADVVRRFTGHSPSQMSQHYYHPLLKQELKATEKYQDKIDKIWE